MVLSRAKTVSFVCSLACLSSIFFVDGVENYGRARKFPSSVSTPTKKSRGDWQKTRARGERINKRIRKDELRAKVKQEEREKRIAQRIAALKNKTNAITYDLQEKFNNYDEFELITSDSPIKRMPTRGGNYSARRFEKMLAEPNNKENVIQRDNTPDYSPTPAFQIPTKHRVRLSHLGAPSGNTRTRDIFTPNMKNTNQAAQRVLGQTNSRAIQGILPFNNRMEQKHTSNRKEIN